MTPLSNPMTEAQICEAKAALDRAVASRGYARLSQWAMNYGNRLIAAARQSPAAGEGEPIKMVLHCPKCGLQHIDTAENNFTGDASWDNPPHRSHLCHGCGHIWRPADVPTEGVAAVQTKGKADSPIASREAPAVQAEPVGWMLFGKDGKPYEGAQTEGLEAYSTKEHAAEFSAGLIIKPVYDRASPPIPDDLRKRLDRMNGAPLFDHAGVRVTDAAILLSLLRPQGGA